MTDEDLIGYLLDALGPADRAAAEARLAADPAAAARLDRWRAALAPLSADRPDPPVPSGLADRTLARVAEVAGPDRPPTFPAPPRAPRESPDLAGLGGRFLRADVVVAGGIALFAFGLVVSGIGKVRARNDLVACRDNLRTLHGGLEAYAGTRGGQYPQIGTGAPAGTFATALADAGCVPAGFRPACPADRSAGPVGLTYSLGYRDGGGALVGPCRPADGEHDLVPISADLPTAAAAPPAGPVSPHPGGMNVLFAGGHVRFATTPHVGPGGDHIFLNAFGLPRAGAHRADAVLGRPGDVP